jgi:hypothetical protein
MQADDVTSDTELPKANITKGTEDGMSANINISLEV